jgi:hypothetical protein
MDTRPPTSLHVIRSRAIVLELIEANAPRVEVEMALDQAQEVAWQVGRSAGLCEAKTRKADR